MEYAPNEAALFGLRLVEAGTIGLKRNKDEAGTWFVEACPDTMQVTLHGRISEPVCDEHELSVRQDCTVFLEHRQIRRVEF